MKHWKIAGIASLALCLAGAGLWAQGSRYIVPADRALIIMRVPTDDATIKIGAHTLGQRGLERMYLSPELTPGNYAYQVEVQWTEGGQARRAVRSVRCQPGQVTNTVFSSSDAGESIAPPKTGEKSPVAKGPSKARSFIFTYGGAVKDLAPGTEAEVWLPVAVSGAEQDVKIWASKVPANAKIGKEKQYGNTMMHFKAKANDKGQIPFEVSYQVTRHEVKTNISANAVLKPTPDDNMKRFLQPDALVPISGKPLELLKDKKLPKDQFDTAKVMYDVVNTHMKYSKDGIGWGKGDSVWACDSKFGNCTDFHSLFISMARGNKIPSKFEMGFSIPLKRGEGPIGGYHCWAWFNPGDKGWIPVDISEANRFPDMKEYYFGNLTEDRVRFTTGRDINLEPKQKAGPLNFFIYPYAEVDGKVHPQEKMERRFAYEDVK